MYLFAQDPDVTGSVKGDPQIQSSVVVKTNFEAAWYNPSFHMGNNADPRLS